jgi:hypothetical protein
MATKKAFIILFVFLTGSIPLYAQIISKVELALSQFNREYPEYAAKASITNTNRLWQDQMRIILSRPDSYPNISRHFAKEFGLSLPTSQSMTSEMLKWWETEINKQAGRADGFAHVGGKAVDVSVKNLDSTGTQLLAGVLQNNGLRILYEENETYKNTYFVGTLLLHCY